MSRRRLHGRPRDPGDFLNRFQLAWTWLGIRGEERDGYLCDDDLSEAASLFTTDPFPGSDHARLVSLLYKSMAPEVDED